MNEGNKGNLVSDGKQGNVLGYTTFKQEPSLKRQGPTSQYFSSGFGASDGYMKTL